MFNLTAGEHACMHFPRLWRGTEGEAFTRYLSWGSLLYQNSTSCRTIALNLWCKPFHGGFLIKHQASFRCHKNQ